MMMKRNLAVALSVLIILSSSLIIPSLDVDADDSPEETWYCYGNIMLLKYPFDDEVTVHWTVVGYKDGLAGDTQEYDGINVAINVSDFDYLIVKQVVSNLEGAESDSKVIDVIPLGLKSGESIHVRFIDGSKEISRYTLDSSKSIRVGDPFVTMPEDPEKANYRFTGWYLDSACTQSFDPYLPIRSDTTVYAGWTSAGSSGSITVSGYLVTFNAVPGLTYQVVGTGDSAVSFTVFVMDGYRFDMDSIQASVGTTKISPVNGVYTLSGISKDTVIEITGDRLYSVSYDTRNVPVSSEDLGSDHLSVSFTPAFGWSGVSLRVIMGGADVTSQYADGSSVDIDVLTGDVIIIAQADFPWIYVLIIVLVVLIALVAIILVKRRKAD